MNAVTPFPVGECWNATHASVNAWRGRAVHLFSRAEAEVSETLLALAGIAGRGKAVRLQQPVGHRLAEPEMVRHYGKRTSALMIARSVAEPMARGESCP